MDVIYLASCAVNGRTPDAQKVGKMDLSPLYSAADRHMLTGITAMALESAGVRDREFTQAKGKAVRKVAAFDVEREAIFSRFEDAGIWYLTLKGAVLKSFYPKIGMRQMSDNDILFDDSRTPDVRKIMESLGYEVRYSFGVTCEDHYVKPPSSNFEMHRYLFEKNSAFFGYYENVKDRLLPNEGSSFGYHFSDEDFYIYIIAHEYKHYASGGTGLRSLLDTYVYLKEKGGSMDREYISAELEKLGIADFEEKNRSLSMHLFGGEELSSGDREILDYILSSGTYGTVRNRVNNGINGYGDGFRGKVKYIFSRIFLPLDSVRRSYPLFIKIPVLLPFLPFYRLIKGLVKRRRMLKEEVRTIARH